MPRSHSFSEASFLPLHCCIEYLRDREIVGCLNCPLHSCLVMSHHSLLPSTGSRLLQQRPFSRAQRPNKFHLRVRTQASKEGDNLVNEDLLAKLKAAEEEAQRLKKELATAKSQAEATQTSEASSQAARRIDSGDLKRETLFTTESKQRNWLSESDVNFFTGGGPSELGEGPAASSEEQEAIVKRRLLIGLGLTGALGAFALVPTEKLEAPPNKPLFFYLVPLLRVQALLQQAEAVVPDGDYPRLKAIIDQIKGSNNLQTNLRSAAACLSDSRAVSAAEAVGREVYEYVEQMDYDRYFESMPGSRNGAAAKQYNDFSFKATKTAQLKLKEFLALMPREQLEAAQQQINSLPF